MEHEIDVSFRIREDGEDLLLEYSSNPETSGWEILKVGSREDRAALEKQKNLFRAAFLMTDDFS